MSKMSVAEFAEMISDGSGYEAEDIEHDILDYIKDARAEERAAVMQEYGILNAEDSRALLDSLANPKPPTDALKRALRRDR